MRVSRECIQKKLHAHISVMNHKERKISKKMLRKNEMTILFDLDKYIYQLIIERCFRLYHTDQNSNIDRNVESGSFLVNCL